MRTRVEAAPQQVSCGAHLGRVDIGLRDHAAAQECGDLKSIDPIVLGFAAVDGFHVQSMTEDEEDFLTGAQVGNPIPSEHALDGNDQVVTVRSDGAEKDGRIATDILVKNNLPSLVQHAEVHGSGV